MAGNEGIGVGWGGVLTIVTYPTIDFKNAGNPIAFFGTTAFPNNENTMDRESTSTEISRENTSDAPHTICHCTEVRSAIGHSAGGRNGQFASSRKCSLALARKL